MSFFAPLKRAWRKILDDIKTKQPTLNCVEKSIFPSLLRKLITEIRIQSSKNIQSGFRATGIYPLQPDEVLKKLGGDKYKKRVSREIDASLLSYLQAKKASKEKITSGKKKKMLKIKPGCSVTAEDIENQENDIDKDSESENEIDNDPSTSHPTAENEFEDQAEQEDQNQGITIDVSEDITNTQNENNEIKQGAYIVVQFCGKKSIKHFIGIVLNTEDEVEDEDNSIFVKFMKKGAKGFIFPEIDDTSVVNLLDVKEVLETPTIDRRGEYLFQNKSLRKFHL